MQTVFRAEHEPLDRLPAPVWPAVPGERDGFIATGDSAREVERDATQEGSVVNRQGRLDLALAPVFLDKGVDPGCQRGRIRQRVEVHLLLHCERREEQDPERAWHFSATSCGGRIAEVGGRFAGVL